MRYSKCAVLQNSGSQERCEGSGDKICLTLRIWFWEGLESFVRSKAIAYREILVLSIRMGLWYKHTDVKDEPFRWCFCSCWPLYSKLSHSRHNGANKIYVEDREYVDNVENNRNGQKAKAIDARHNGWM